MTWKKVKKKVKHMHIKRSQYCYPGTYKYKPGTTPVSGENVIPFEKQLVEEIVQQMDTA